MNHHKIIGYTAGVFDLFHVGHLNLLKNAKGLCDKLIVGVSTDELVQYKNKQAVIPFLERAEIVRSIKYVDAVVSQQDMNKIKMWEKLKFNIMFVGDDWFDTPKWQGLESQFKKLDVKIIYFPYTSGVSSTKINETLEFVRNNFNEYTKVKK
ncbi:MAG: adenylyltransferase/cytidyltransferase family protein [Alphaproteobacteria bacterium]|nr:adenylyltransferase/cytidyltransferase family protein [Alphaproteobacteria bacterium]